MPETEGVYYRIYVPKNDFYDGKTMVVVTVQWFDEYDYDQNRFVNNVCYSTEAEAHAEIYRLCRLFGLAVPPME